MSQALHLDFLVSQQRHSKLGWFFLVVGVALAGWQLLAYSQMLQANSELRFELDSTLDRLNSHKQEVMRQPTLTPQERLAIAQARAATAQLNYPWDSLLHLMQDVQRPDIALLALEPKSQSGQIRLTAEAKDTSAMMSYLSSFQQSPLLHNALLTSHQLQMQQPGTPVKFQILAQWKGLQKSPSSDHAVVATQSAGKTEKVAQ
ncbi:MAG: hypothetical protein ABIQ90_01600 [Polaromonas sp.]